MAFIKSMRVLFIKGVDDPFTLTRLTRESIGHRDRQEFDELHKKVGSYLELVTLCEKYVILDPTKLPSEQPEFGTYRDLYNDKIVPWRQRVWDTATFLLNDAQVVKTWKVIISEDHQRVSLHLSHKTASGVYSPSVELERGKHSFSPETVKIRCYPGLAMNTTLEKATPSKIAMKLIERGTLALNEMNARQARKIDENSKKVKARQIVERIETMYGIPRYYDGSTSLELSTEGVKLTVEPSEYGYAVVNVRLIIGDEPLRVHSDRLEPLISVVKGIKVKNDMLKEKKAIDEKRKKEVAK